MDIQKDYSCIERNSVVMSKNLDVDNDFQEALPAYCDDIYRVVKCLARSCITSADINYNEVKIYGKTEICLTYYNENSNLCYADFEEEFSKTVNVENLSDSAFVCASVDEKYTNFRVINQRRIDIHTSGIIHLCVYDKVKCPCISSCTDSKLREQSIKTANVIASDISRIEFDEEFSIPADSQPIKRIVSRDAFATLSEVKVIKDKALIKAVVSVSVLYTTDTENEDLFKSEYSFNASKIIDASGIDDNDIVISNISVGNIYLKAKLSSGDKMNLIEAYGELVVNSVFIRECEQSIISDGYVLNRNSHCSYSDFNCIADGSLIQESRLINVSTDMSSEIMEIKEISVSLSNANIRNGRLLSKACVNAICKVESGDLANLSNTADIEIEMKDYQDAITALSIQSFDFAITQNGRLDLRINIGINSYAFNHIGVKVLTDMEPDDEFIKYPSLTVYFGKQNESVWNIAKSFSSDADMIIRENDLSGDTLDSNKILIIPRV